MGQRNVSKTSLSRREFLRLAGVAGGAAALAACTPQASPTTAAEQKPAEVKATEQPAAPSKQQVTISWWNQFSTDTCKEWFPKIVKVFEEANPNIKVEFEITGGPPGGGDFAELLLARIAAGNPPDTCTLWDPPSGYGARGAMASLDNLMAKAQVARSDAFFPGVLNSCQFKGKTYGLPASAGAGCMFINKKLFEEQGVSTKREDFPKTWNDYRQLSAKFVKWDGDVVTRGGGMPWTSAWLFSTWSQLNGGQVFDSKTVEYKIDSPQNTEWLTFWLDWLNEQYKGDLEKTSTSGNWEDIYPDSQFNKGNLAVANSGAWACTDAVFNFDWEVVPFPTGPSGSKPMTSFWPNWFAMPKGAPHTDEGFLFIEHMTTKGWAMWYTEAIMDTPAWTGYPKDSVNKALAKQVGDARAREIQNFFNEQLKSVSDMWTSPVEAFANDNLGQAIDAVLRKKSTPADALANTQKVVQAKLDETMKSG